MADELAPGWRNVVSIGVAALVLAGIYVTSLHSFLLFHSIIELFTIVVAAGIFVITWNARRQLDNGYLLFVGVASLFVAGLNLLHTLAYRGMGVFADGSGDLATQLWVAGRFLQGSCLLLAPFFLKRRLRVGVEMGALAIAGALLLLSIFYWRIFPVAYVPGVGTTPFKKASEFVVSGMLMGAIILLVRRRSAFEDHVWHLLLASLLLMIFSELAFSSYATLYGRINQIGHFLRLGAFWLLYKAIIETGLVRPYDLLLRSLHRSQEQLREHAAMLELSNDDLRRSEHGLREDALVLSSRNEELDAFAHTVAHDLKNPLSVIVSASAAMRDFPDLPRDKQERLLGRIESIAMAMSGIIDGLLLLSQVRKVEAPSEPVDMAGVVGRVRDRLSEMAREHEALIVAPESWPSALGYAPWLEEVWANYMSNAIRYGGRPPLVELGAAVQPDGMVRFWARDNGPGIPPHARDSLFVPFTRLASHGGGHGLGLSIVLHIVGKLGGQVGVECQDGAGSTFFFTLPAGAPSLPRIAHAHLDPGPACQ